MDLRELYKKMHPEMYFTPDKVMEFINREQNKNTPKLETALGNPPFKVRL